MQNVIEMYPGKVVALPKEQATFRSKNCLDVDEVSQFVLYSISLDNNRLWE